MVESNHADFLLERPDEPLRVSVAIIRLKDGAHEIALHMNGRSVKIIAESAAVIASTERR